MNEPRSTIDRPTRQRRWFRSLYVRAAILSVVIGLALFVLIWWPRRSTWAVLMAGGHIGRMDEWKHFEAGMGGVVATSENQHSHFQINISAVLNSTSLRLLNW